MSHFVTNDAGGGRQDLGKRPEQALFDQPGVRSHSGRDRRQPDLRPGSVVADDPDRDQVDAFTSEPFKENQAAVCLLEKPADEKWMQNVAMEKKEFSAYQASKRGGIVEAELAGQRVKLRGTAVIAFVGELVF